MSNIAKRRTKVPFVEIVSYFLLFIAPEIGFAQTDISPIQLKTMQTRRFTAPPDKVIEAISALHADRYDVQCGVAISTKQIIAANRKYKFHCDISKLPPDDRLLKLTSYHRIYEISTDDQGSETILRHRLYLSAGANRAQSVNPSRYQKHFKEIADTLFIEAIELTPAEIQ